MNIPVAKRTGVSLRSEMRGQEPRYFVSRKLITDNVINMASKVRLDDHMKWTRIEVKTRSRTHLIDITNRISEELTKTGVQNGTCFVFTQHTTAGLTINENADPDVVRDILAGLARLVPEIGDYRHAEGNSDAHIKASLMGFSLTVPIIDGRLALGTWQGLYFCEFDGPRNRQILVGIYDG